MEFKKLYSKEDKSVWIHVAAGHFATNHSHINYYIDLSNVKSYQKMAKKVGGHLAHMYNNVPIDTIISLEGTEMIGSFIADELSQPSIVSINSGNDICVLAPEMNANNQMIFRGNNHKMVYNKNVLLLMASISTGRTIMRAQEAMSYYGGRLVGISAVFSALDDEYGIPIYSAFTPHDLPKYRSYFTNECKMCAENKKLDAIVNSYGYSTL